MAIPKEAIRDQALTVDRWYFDVVSATTNASFTCTFFLNRGGFTGTSETNSSNLVQAWVTFPNGTAVQTSLYVDENENVTVVVLEVGSDATSDPRSFIPALWSNTFGTELDWNFPTIPQVRHYPFIQST